ncbi:MULTISPECIES: bestrophin-like domain [unclassified Nocardia]|uniref:bestrophin-like domain n=1 Tax=unclassified Nocardia TaxID=2637762 RepID=UPI0033A1E1E3
MFTWIYELPIWLDFLLITGTAVGLTVTGILLSRAAVQRAFGPEPGWNETVTMVLTVGGVFYGLLLGLIAAATYESYDVAQSRVADEAAAIGTLYREVSAYPEPYRELLREDLADYTRDVLDVVWPALREGEEPMGGTALVTRFQGHLLEFRPSSSAEEIVHAATIDQFARFDSDRRHRINATKGGIPDVLWWTILVGGAVNLVLLCLFSLGKHAHLVLGGLFAFFLGAMIFLIAALDYPFRGDLSVSSEPFDSVYVNVMGR